MVVLIVVVVVAVAVVSSINSSNSSSIIIGFPHFTLYNETLLYHLKINLVLPVASSRIS